MSLDPNDFKTLQVKLSTDKKYLEVILEALPNGKAIVDDENKTITQNPNYKKWRVGDVSRHIKSLGYKGKCIECSNNIIDNGNDEKLKSVLKFELIKTETSKNEENTTTKPKPKTRTRTKRKTSSTAKG